MRRKLSLAALLAAALFTLPSLAATQDEKSSGSDQGAAKVGPGQASPGKGQMGHGQASQGNGQIGRGQAFQGNDQMGRDRSYQWGGRRMGRGDHGFDHYYGGGYWPRHHYWGRSGCWRWTPGGRRIWVCD